MEEEIKETEPVPTKKDKKKDDSTWELVNVPTGQALAYHNKITDEVLNMEQAICRNLEISEKILKVVG